MARMMPRLVFLLWYLLVLDAHHLRCEQVAETYTQATKEINPRKATAQYHSLWIHFAKFYETGGVAGEGEPDLKSARKLFEKAVIVPFRKVEELAEVWCEWAEMEVRNE